MITGDGGGNNGTSGRLWQQELQGLADEIGITVRVSHFPPGTSKWNKVSHSLFSSITINWRGEPSVSYEMMLDLIANTRTKTGLPVRSELDTRAYVKGIKASDAGCADIDTVRDSFHGCATIPFPSGSKNYSCCLTDPSRTNLLHVTITVTL